MKKTGRVIGILLLTVTVLCGVPRVKAQSVTNGPTERIDTELYQQMRWRMIGPFRAGRTVGATGIPGRPSEFLIGVNNGGVWKTTDFGRTWKPLFDDQPTGSIGDLAVAPSDPSVIYVGSGEGLHRPDLAVGDGMFRSSDGGKTWKHIGLGDAQQISSIAVHPDHPDHVFVGVLGHPYGPSEERGVFETIDGGANWKRILFLDQSTGAMQVTIHPDNPSILFADMWSHQEGPWENASFSGEKSNLYKSTDGGKTWHILSRGLPGAADGLGRIGFDISRSNPDRMYAVVSARRKAGLYRSDDGGESWSLVTTDRRLYGRGDDFGEIKIHPFHPEILFVANIASYTSRDAGETWSSLKGAPGGDDYHRIWINPENPSIMLFAADQGATITVNGGATWSSWYNQPTAQLYHVSTDNQFPYHVYGGQQESGAIMVSSRGDGGQISFRDWQGVGADEYAFIAPDPLNDDIVYGGRVVRFNRKTGQTQNVAPEAVRSGKYRILRSMPLHFSPVDQRALYFATNVLFKTTTGGQSWDIISPDLSREKPDLPQSVGDFATPEMADMPRRGVIYALGLSPLNQHLIWTGSDDGRVSLTTNDGVEWSDVTPSALRSWDKVSAIDAGHFDEQTAYLAINSIRLDDMRPHIFRTHDAGLSWQKITNGLPDNGPVNVVREDPVQPGLLYAGTERAVYVSFDDGANWNPLRQNMPATSIRDLVVHENDLVAGTHGRSIWIMDGLAPLRQALDAVSASPSATPSATNPFLVKPDVAIRVRDNMFGDTPLPPEEPAGENPPDGAMLDYYLPVAAGSVALEIRDAAGHLVRRYSSEDPPERIDSTGLAHPTYWIRPAQRVKTVRGMHRFIWNLRHSPPEGANRSFSIAATHRNTPSGPEGPFVVPGTYAVHLLVDGLNVQQSIEVRIDPRVEASGADIATQHSYAMASYEGYGRAQSERSRVAALVDQIAGAKSKTEDKNILDALNEVETAALKYSGTGTPGNPDIVYSSVTEAAPGQETLLGIQQKLLFLMTVIDSADERPTTQAIRAVDGTNRLLNDMIERWAGTRRDRLTGLNDKLKAAGMPPIE